MHFVTQKTGPLWGITVAGVANMSPDDPLRSLYNDSEVTNTVSTYMSGESDFKQLCMMAQEVLPEEELLEICEQVGWSVKDRQLLKRYLPPPSFVTEKDPRGEWTNLQ